jgi:hypothetical protein
MEHSVYFTAFGIAPTYAVLKCVQERILATHDFTHLHLIPLLVVPPVVFKLLIWSQICSFLQHYQLFSLTYLFFSALIHLRDKYCLLIMLIVLLIQ